VSQSRGILEVIKSVAKRKGITYRHLAAKMGKSEVTVKRIFSEQKLTMERLEEICSILGMTLHEVIELASLETRSALGRFTLEQEKALAADPRMLSLFYLVATHMTFEQILRHYEFERPELTKYLVQFDRLGIIDLLPNSRYRMKIKMNARWIVKGPLIKRYGEEIKADYMNTPFTGPGEFFKMYHGYLSEASLNIVATSLERVLVEMQQLSDVDEASAKKARRISVVVAARPWTYALIEQYRR
jgi:transcriptional regulator with XRE-family HTH domain